MTGAPSSTFRITARGSVARGCRRARFPCSLYDWRVALVQLLSSTPARSITAGYLGETGRRLKFGHALKLSPAGLTRCLR